MYKTVLYAADEGLRDRTSYNQLILLRNCSRSIAQCVKRFLFRVRVGIGFDLCRYVGVPASCKGACSKEDVNWLWCKSCFKMQDVKQDL